MSSVIWYGEGDDDGIDLGDPGAMWRSFAEIGKVVGDDPAFDELQSIPGFAEQVVTPWWLDQARAQAERFLAEHGQQVSPGTRAVLENLTEEPVAAGTTALKSMTAVSPTRILRFRQSSKSMHHDCHCTDTVCSGCVDDLLRERFAGDGYGRKAQPGEAYKYAADAYGLDVPFSVAGSAEPIFDDRLMSITWPFAASQGRDRVGDFLEVDGIRLDNHRTNPVSYLDHAKSCYPLPFAITESPTRVYRVWIDSATGLAWAEGFIDQKAKSPIPLECYRMFKSRILRTGSIGYRVLVAKKLPPDPEVGLFKSGLHIIECELLEPTLCSMPVNADAVRKAFEGFDGRPLSEGWKAMLEPWHGKSATVVGGWDTKGFDESKVKRNHGQFSSTAGGSGGAAATTGAQAKKKAKRLPTAPPRKTILERAGHALTSAGAKIVAAGLGVPKEKLGALIEQVPEPVRAPVGNLWHAVHGVLMAGNHGIQALAKQVSKDKGLDDAQVEKLGNALGWIDISFQGAMMGTAAAAAATANPLLAVAAKAASYCPAASVGYLLGSSASPKGILRTLKSALTLLKERFPAQIKGAAEFAWGAIRHPLTVPKHEDLALAGAGHKALGTSANEDAEILATAYAHAENKDWWLALFAIAFDDTRNVREAVEMADAVASESEGPPEDAGSGPLHKVIRAKAWLFPSRMLFWQGKADPAAAEHAPGDKWQGPSGRWFTKLPTGRVVPTAGPGQAEKPKKEIKPKVSPEEKAKAKQEAVEQKARLKAELLAQKNATKQAKEEAKAKAKEEAKRIKEEMKQAKIDAPKRILEGIGKGEFRDAITLTAAFSKLTVAQIGDLKKQFNLVGKGDKAEMVRRLAAHVLAERKPEKPPEKAFKSGERVPLAGVRDRLERAGAGALAEMQKIMEEAGEDIGGVKTHGMATARSMKELDIDGVKFQYSKNATGAAQGIMHAIHKDMPEALYKATHTVTFTTLPNQDDAHWEKTYGIANFKSVATGGDGSVCVYHGGAASFKTMAHESGHNLASKLWGNTKPDPASEYGQAQAQEKPVTKYGASSPSEDFAEACALMATDAGRKTLQSQFPKKHAALSKIFSAPAAKQAAAKTDDDSVDLGI